MPSLALLTSPRNSRFIKYILAPFFLWYISVQTFHFNLSLSVEPEPSPRLPNEDYYTGKNGLGKSQGEESGSKLHLYRQDGFLEVNHNGRHPILELMERAEKDWKAKLERASTSLEDAVKEYKRRYKRDPPKGFDQWWDYVEKHNIQLPDEYDEIYLDLQPFWGISPSDLLVIQKELEEKKDSYTIGKTESTNVTIVRTSFREELHQQLIKGTPNVVNLLRDIEEYLPPFRATFSPHDGPNRLSDFEVKDFALEAASMDTHLTRESFPEASSLGWLSACSPRSRARNLPVPFRQKQTDLLNLDSPAPPSESPVFPYHSSSTFQYPNFTPDIPRTKNFIFDHLKTMDPCSNPALFWTHGQFLGRDEGPAPQPYLVPEFAPCTTTIHHNIRVPSLYAWVNDLADTDNPDWELREDDRLLWRGSNTGIGHSKTTRWSSSHRNWMVMWGNGVNGTVDVMFSEVDDAPAGKPKTMRRARLNPSLIDMKFAGKLHCWDDDTCKLIERIYPVSKKMSEKEAGNYKYIMDVDGNGWSGRFKRLMTSKALILKATIYPEWYYSRIQAWFHYVPVQVDMSDLYDILVFFRGDPNGNGSHDELAKKIALQGREWSKTFWKREDLVAYFYRLILEYARVASPNREKMNYTPVAP
ncbi:hypothetical protein E1B28_011072 [Marasmius oreades]|uniref:Glycosyl transferase CAP10 domain-containing protein n=1 Tax=Marasmius oreades TaxID=181124 RepID=A0A9P7RTH8_9AGAR|nr:uncharacterized protein E1B28_011072 [Marasmius oreades]KAG7089382.1 hypothetical protein E1B28_011072 [Marasmius oreades]